MKEEIFDWAGFFSEYNAYILQQISLILGAELKMLVFIIEELDKENGNRQ